MRATFRRGAVARRFETAFADPQALASLLGEPQLPDEITGWLSRLMILSGVPINYLVPDEGMLPPESIRFFCVDMNWIDALVDGAFSIGRIAAPHDDGTHAASMNLDRALFGPVRAQAAAAASRVRARKVGVAAAATALQTVTGFLLRSSVVTAYKGIGVNAYPIHETPDDPKPRLLTLLRCEVLGPGADTLLCLVDGDAYRADVHEAPEHLHYGLDSYRDENGTIAATKAVRSFTRDDKGNVTVSPTATTVDVSASFRTSAPRTLRIADLSSRLAQQSPPLSSLDSAEMGFEMTEGVGVVKFVRSSE